MLAQHTSTSASPYCCEYHNRKSAKKCMTEMSHSLHLPTIHEIRKQPCGSHLGVTLYIVLAVLLLVSAITVLAVLICSFIVTKELYSEVTARLTGMALLGVCAAVVVVAVAIAIYAVRKKKRITLQTVSTIIVILVVVEILVVVFAVSIKENDIDKLESTLTDSFLMIVDKEDEASIKKWGIYQTMYECCGLIGPGDFDYPEIPYSCCPSSTKYFKFTPKYDYLVCMNEKIYKDRDGCVVSATNMLLKTVRYILLASLVFVILEVLFSGVGFYLVKKSHRVKNNPPPLTNEKLPEDPPE